MRAKRWNNYLRAGNGDGSLGWEIDTQTYCGSWEKMEIIILAEPLYVEIDY